MKFSDINLEEILNDKAVEEDLLEVPLTDKVFKVFSLIVFVVIGLVLVRFIFIGVFKHSFYSKRALANVSEAKIELAPRGIVSDRFGETLLSNEPAFNVFLAPKFLPQAINERIEAIEEISQFLALSKEEINKKIAKKDWTLSDRLLIANNISHDQLVSLYSKQIPGLVVEASFRRVPAASLKHSHVLGFVGLVDEKDLETNSDLTIYDEIGRNGLEAYYDNYLRGINGKEIFYRNVRGKIEESKVTQAARPGYHLETYIDSVLQEYFYDSLQNALTNLGRKRGVGIAINPQNGEVLALVNIPSFDTTDIADSLDNPNKALFNRAVSGLYNPGSTIKPLVALAALAENIIAPAKQIFSAGFIELPNPYEPERPSRFLDWKAHGWVDLYSAIARSSNVYFYSVGGGFKDQRGLGIVKLNEWWRKFALDKKTGIDLPGEKAGFLPDPEWKEKTLNSIWRLGDTFNVSIGQGDLLITPLELLNYISAIANGGKFYQPRIMKAIKDENGKIISESKPVVFNDLTSSVGAVLPEIQKAMQDAVTKPYGTAHLLNELPISIAAKTGSAQIDNNTKENAFIVGYAPVKNPEIAFLVLIEDAREGSLNTVPVAREMLMWYYKNRLLKQKAD